MKAAIILFFSVFIFSIAGNSSPLVVNAGTGSTICPGTTVTLGGTPTATGGTAPYSYLWSPSSNISSITVPNPIGNPAVPTWYFVTVTDDSGHVAIDSIFIDLDPIWAFNAGQDTGICIGSTLQLGSIWNSTSGGVTYQWAPATNLDDPSLPRPTTNTTVTITYSVIITSPNCPSKSFSITVTVNDLPIVDACCLTTILEGESTVLTATGGVNYQWTPSNTVSNQFASPTTVEPIQTTLYTVYGIDQNGCLDWDTVTVFVTPSTDIYFYNTFSPNQDGINDYFYIGNATKYITNRLEVYTRTGQLVYAKTNYDNTWDGTNYGDKLPEATYYFTFIAGDGSPAHFGSVTIVR